MDYNIFSIYFVIFINKFIIFITIFDFNRFINIKYGKECNEFINKNILIEKEINNLNIICDKQKNKTIEKIIEFMNFDRTNIVSDENNNYWFNATKFCKYLNYLHPKNAIDYVDKKNKNTLKTIYKNYKNLYKNAQGHAIYINELGLYSLIFRSKMENAEKIRNLISDELID